jgi:hypothetical protein
MIIHLQFGFSQFISFREEDLWNFSQSEHIIGPGSHVEYPTGTKNSNFAILNFICLYQEIEYQKLFENNNEI